MRGPHAPCRLRATTWLWRTAYIKAHLRNLAENTGTMAFMLGLFFEGWVHAAASPEVQSRWSAERVARDFFYISKYHVAELARIFHQDSDFWFVESKGHAGTRF